GAENVEHASVPTSRATPLVEPRHGLRVVVVDVRLRVQHRVDRVLAALEVGNEYFDRAIRKPGFDLPNGFREDVGAEVGQVIAVDGGDDRVLQVHLGDGL